MTPWLTSANLAASSTEQPVKQCATCNLETFEEYKQMRQQQILLDLLTKLELTSKPNVTVDYDNLPPIGHRHPKVKALIEQTIREKKRARRSLSYMNDGEYLPHLYETDSDKKPQFSFIMAERAPWPLQDTLDIAVFNLGPSMRKKYVHKANLHLFLRRPSALHHVNQAAIRIDVYERFVNGTIGEKIATKFDMLHGSRAVFPVTVPLDSFDVQTWFQTRVSESPEPFVGVYVEAMFDDEENLAFHPRDRYPDVSSVDSNVR
ncbi:DAF-7 protein [Aphelenchoides bicaudatus]|nr:DAF-7 protein [Aphelenchoides bicaudatus]